MIRILNSMRYKLAAENKAGKYVRYAIGEIILVVIGIVIALQIDNWNEDRKDHLLENELLVGLKNEFENNLINIQKDLDRNLKCNQASDEIAAIIRQGNYKEQDQRMDSLLIQLIVFGSFDAETGFSDEIIHSGRLNLIQNQTIRTQITRWPRLLKDAEEDIVFRMENYNHILIPYLLRIFPMRKGEPYKDLSYVSCKWQRSEEENDAYTTRWNLVDPMDFDNILWHYKHSQDYIVMNDYVLKAFIKETLSLINTELKK